MTDPTPYPSSPVAPAPAPIPLSWWDRVRPSVAPVAGWLVSLACTAVVKGPLGVRWNVQEVPVEVQVPLTVALMAGLAEIVKLVTAAFVNPSSSASPTFAKAAKASPIGSASEGAATIAAQQQQQQQATAEHAALFPLDVADDGEPRPLVADHDEGLG